jgi:predicted RNase H-like HicB family nuclease
MLMTKFTLEYWQEGGLFVGRLVEAPGVFSQGETLEELEENIQEAYKLTQQSHLDLFPSGRKRMTVDLPDDES